MHPMQCEYKYARKLRCSPLYSVLERCGAVFGTRMAFERPLYFDTSQTRELCDLILYFLKMPMLRQSELMIFNVFRLGPAGSDASRNILQTKVF